MPKKRLKSSAIKRLRIRLAYIDGKETMEQIGREFGVDQGTVSRYMTGFVRPDDGKNFARLWDRWCQEAPKSWELDREDFACLIAGCHAMRVRSTALRKRGIDIALMALMASDDRVSTVSPGLRPATPTGAEGVDSKPA